MPHTSPDGATSLLYLVKRLELVIRAQLDEMLRDGEVTTLQYTALTVLDHRDGISAAQLARDSFVTPQSMSDMLRTLELRGLVRRDVNPRSRRELLVFITDAGRQLLAEHADAAAEIERRMLGDLTAEEAAQLRRLVVDAWAALRTMPTPQRLEPPARQG